MTKPSLPEIFASPPVRPDSDRDALAAALLAIIERYDALAAPLAARLGDEIPLWSEIQRARALIAATA